MKRFIQKFWWFLLLVAISVYFFLNKMQSSTINERYKRFAVDNVSDISEITINNDSISLRLSNVNGEWLVNQSFQARKESVEAFLYLISNIQPSFPLPISVADSLRKVLNDNGLNVKISSGNKIVRDYWVHSTSTLSLGGIGMLKNSKYAFQLSVPNYHDDVVHLFITDPSMWIDNVIHLKNISDAVAIEVELPNAPEKSFRFDINKNQRRLFALYYGKAASTFDEEKASSFINHLKSITITNLDNEISSEQKAGIIFSQPDFIYKIYSENGKKFEIKIIPIPVDEYLDEFGRPVQFDLNRVYVTHSNDSKNIYQAKYTDIYPILKDISYFQPKFDQ